MRRVTGFIVVFAGLPLAAHAHLVQTGFGSFYDGIAHFAIAPRDVLVVCALALLAGMRGARASRGVSLLLPAAWLIGGFAGRIGPASDAMLTLTAVSSGIIGLGVALNLNVPVSEVWTVACLVGGLHGYVDGATMPPGGSHMWLAIVGTAAAVFVAATVLPAFVVSLRVEWMRIAVRVAGSWIAAIGMLMVGWLARGAAH